MRIHVATQRTLQQLKLESYSFSSFRYGFSYSISHALTETGTSAWNLDSLSLVKWSHLKWRGEDVFDRLLLERFAVETSAALR